MASFFGEILEPTSRAIFEEFSDDEEEIEPIELRLVWFQTKEVLPSALDVVYIYHGKLSLVFAETYLIAESANPIAEINIGSRSDCGEDDIAHKNCNLLPSRIYLDNNLLTCLVSPTYSSDLAFQFTNCIAPFLKIAEKVVIFTDESFNNFQAPTLKDLPPAFMRELKTSHNNSDFIVEELTIPNIVTHIPAAVVSWCQIFKKAASLFICFSDQQKLDSLTAAPYISVIKKLDSKLIKNTNPAYCSKKFYGNPDVIGGSSNIYI